MGAVGELKPAPAVIKLTLDCVVRLCYTDCVVRWCPMARRKKRLTLEVGADTEPKVRLIAMGRGVVTTSGSQAGQGSLSGLLDAIARGGFAVVPVSELTESQRIKFADIPSIEDRAGADDAPGIAP